MENSDWGHELDKYIDASNIQKALGVSKTQSYEIIKEIEAQDRTKGAVLRWGRMVRVKQSAFLDWREEHTGPRDGESSAYRFMPSLYMVA